MKLLLVFLLSLPLTSVLANECKLFMIDQEKDSEINLFQEALIREVFEERGYTIARVEQLNLELVEGPQLNTISITASERKGEASVTIERKTYIKKDQALKELMTTRNSRSSKPLWGSATEKIFKQLKSDFPECK